MVGPETLFEAGRLVGTPGALSAFGRNIKVSVWDYLQRHITGDWGEVSESDAKVNAWAVENGERICSRYTLPDGTKLMIITEADRSVTTLMLPEEY